MQTSDLITENKASSFAGVSNLTLGRFAEAGYLKVETDSSGEKLYSQTELRNLFGLTSEIVIERSVPDVSLTNYFENNQLDSQELKTDLKNYDNETIQPETNQFAFNDFYQSEAQPLQQFHKETELDRKESSRMSVVIEMQEKLLDMRDREIFELRRERDWLRQRVERFEDKSERDQLLLLTETQMIRKLFVLNQQKKASYLRGALEWLGLIPPVNNNHPQLTSTSSDLTPRISNKE